MRLIAAIGLVSVTAGLGVIALLDAPHELFALVGAIAAVALAASSFWKISIHAGVTAGSVGALVVVFGAWALLLSPLVALVGWARVVRHHHTITQVIVRAIVGALVAWGAMTVLV
ncbi:hypothetical protein [Oryzobacter terrae]|uniref:hypothetical protein n=1 Tax=Oryzobacter terrae TaxID=1620385 RepID=UPI003671459C